MPERKGHKRVNLFTGFLCLFLLVFSCIPPSEEEYTEININYNDPDIRKVLELENEQDLDSLLLLLSNPNPTLRLFAAKAFGSFQDTKALDSLINLLDDPFLEVRSAVAYALGQSGDEKTERALMTSFSQQDSIDVNNKFNANILESIGKIGSESLLESMATISTYRRSDTLLLLGQVRGIYQYGLRGIFHPEATKTMINYILEEYPFRVQLYAANYLSRFPTVEIAESKFQLLKYMQESNSPEIRMALATALTNDGSNDLLTAILNWYKEEKDYRVKCNILRKIHNFPYISVVEAVLNELGNENEKIALCAAEYLMNHGNAYDAPIYRNFLNSIQHDRVKIALHKAILNKSGRNSGSRGIAINALKNFVESPDVNEYMKAEALLALGEDIRNHEYVYANGMGSDIVLLRTKGTEALVNMIRTENASRFGGGQYVGLKKQISGYLQEAIESGDEGMVSAASGAFLDEELNFSEIYDDLSFLTKSRDQLDIPEELEAYLILNNVIEKLGLGQKKEAKNIQDKVKAIDWALFDNYSSRPKAKINTNKGEIILELYKNECPNSVLNFIELSRTGFYNNKFFHRVVPNFVIQTGCPRGDGYGALDYTIRTETAKSYYEDEGFIGYASAGKHTESTQWFITHSPTPHLNGNYTIFGKVLSGMNVVHNIELGDKINRITITN